MHQRIRYLSHPQVLVDPAKGIMDWSLSDLGRHRVITLANSNALDGTTVVISSAETKAAETARPLAKALNCRLDIREMMHENDRSSTGFLPPEEFEAVADQFFAYPDTSVRGWETAAAAQSRIVDEIRTCLTQHEDGDVLFVGHGAVGTLLFCHLSGLPIHRKFDQGPGGGGCFFEFSNLQDRPTSGWRPMEDMTGTQNPK
jgi:broad specificity phosphatase PhoE